MKDKDQLGQDLIIDGNIKAGSINVDKGITIAGETWAHGEITAYNGIVSVKNISAPNVGHNLTVQVNGQTVGTYNGASDQVINIQLPDLSQYAKKLDLSNFATKSDLNGYLKTSGGTINGDLTIKGKTEMHDTLNFSNGNNGLMRKLQINTNHGTYTYDGSQSVQVSIF